MVLGAIAYEELERVLQLSPSMIYQPANLSAMKICNGSQQHTTTTAHKIIEKIFNRGNKYSLQ